MITRKLQSPGIEINEFDRSNYNKVDYSLPNSPINLIIGFASEGEDLALKWINSSSTLKETYGQPTTEFEAYFYNAATEILNRGGTCIAAKLPYKNEAYEQYSYVDYKIGELSAYDSTTLPYSLLYLNDNNLTSFFDISFLSSGNTHLSVFDRLLTNEQSLNNNTIRIYDITRGIYKSLNNIDNIISTTSTDEDGNTITLNTNDFLGIIPVIVTPWNAMFFQNILTHSDDNLAISSYYERFNSISQLTSISINGVDTSNLSNINEYTTIPIQSIPFDTFDRTVYNNVSLAREAALKFPEINFNGPSHFDDTYLKQIGIVVFKAYKDMDNNGKVNYQLLESFVGSLNKKAKDQLTNSSIFIDDVINNNSKYIRVFSTANQYNVEKASSIVMQGQTAVSLGFYKKQTKKIISYTDSIIKPLTYILDRAANVNNVPLDLLIDAGVSNIAFLARCNTSDLDTDNKPKFSNYTIPQINNTSVITGWSVILQKFDNFCKNIRKDCMFLADGLRPFCLDGDQKYIRKTAPSNTIANSILPKLQFMTNILNSSYSAGYCNWFYQQDYSNTYDYLWIPPSIKAAGVYIHCDIYSHPWSAPAGINRGKIHDAIDVAFVPNEVDAGKLYSNEWNYAMNYPIDGIILEGHKTFQMQKTALDRVNVRRLLLWLEKQVKTVARKFVYESNTEYLRQLFVDNIRPFFENAVLGDGIKEYGIKCDNELNTIQVIENNEIRCKIAVKPVKVVDWIIIDLISTRQSANISEELVR